MRRQNLCFSCKGFWEPNHQCTDNKVKKLEEDLVVTHRCIEEEATKKVDLEMHMLHEDVGVHESHHLEGPRGSHNEAIEIKETYTHADVICNHGAEIMAQDTLNFPMKTPFEPALGNGQLAEDTVLVESLEDTTDKYDVAPGFLFYDSSHNVELTHEIAAISCEDDGCVVSPNIDTPNLGVKNGLCDEDSSHNKSDFANQTLENESENSLIGDESQDHSTDGYADALEEVCEDIVKTTASTMSFEPSYEVHSSNTFDDIVCTVDSTHDAASHIVSNDDSASYHSADYKSEDLSGDDSSHGYHHLAGQLKVNDNMIATALEHFDVARQMLATYGWSTPEMDEHDGSGLSLTEFYTLREAIGIMKNNYLLLLSDRDYLLKWDGICFGALKGKEEEISSSPMSLRLPWTH